jgi:Rhs element Vgr protein
MSETRTIPSSATGADVVTFTVKIEGEAVARSFNISSVIIQRQAFRIPSCKLIIYDGDPAQSNFPASNADLFIPGKKLELWAGYETDESLLFSGIVVKQALKIRNEKSPVLEVEAKDVCVKLSTTAKSKYFADMSDQQVIEQIIQDAGLQTDIESTGAALKEIVQYHASDWDFIMTRAEANGLICYCEDGKLIAKKPDLSATETLSVLFGATMLEMDAEMDARNQFETLHAQTWNPADQELVDVEANATTISNAGNLSSEDLSAATGNEKKIIQHGAAMPEQQLQQWADAQLMRNRLSKIKGSAKFLGYADVKPGQMIAISGVGDRFSSNAYISGIRHELFDGNWATTAQFGLDETAYAKAFDMSAFPASAYGPAIKGLHIAVVTDLEDPLNEFRVKIKIPSISMQDEGMWARMSMPDAGDKRGFFFRPEVGDEVLIGFLNEDPNYPVILGGLHSSVKAAPFQQNNNNHEKGLQTRSEMKWLWNDEKKSFTTETPVGKKIIVDEDAGEIQIADENGNKFLMNADGITIEAAKAITIKAGTDLKLEALNAELKASASGKLNASGSMEVSSSGSTAVKGSVVQIN